MRNSLKRLTLVAFTVGAAATIAGCQDTASAGPSNGSAAAPVAPAATANVAQPPAEAAPPVKQWKMPNLVGSNLQQAQDQIQALTGNEIFFTTSHDATGQHRNQILDSNWKVCSQNIRPGVPIADDTKIDFGAVKLAESCP